MSKLIESDNRINPWSLAETIIKQIVIKFEFYKTKFTEDIKKIYTDYNKIEEQNRPRMVINYILDANNTNLHTLILNAEKEIFKISNNCLKDHLSFSIIAADLNVKVERARDGFQEFYNNEILKELQNNELIILLASLRANASGECMFDFFYNTSSNFDNTYTTRESEKSVDDWLKSFDYEGYLGSFYKVYLIFSILLDF